MVIELPQVRGYMLVVLGRQEKVMPGDPIEAGTFRQILGALFKGLDDGAWTGCVQLLLDRGLVQESVDTGLPVAFRDLGRGFRITALGQSVLSGESVSPGIAIPRGI